jgi:hypothetical protein
MFCRVLDTRRQPAEDDLAWVRESAARRAEESMPIEVVLTAYHVGAAICIDRLQREAQPADVADLLAVHHLLLGYLQRLTAAVAAGYFEQRRTMFGDEHGARHALLTALLDGEAAQPAAERAGIRLPAWYVVLHLVIGQRAASPIAAKRHLRRLRVELEHAASDPVLSMLSTARGPVLVPMSTVDWDRVARLVQRLQTAGDALVTAGAAAAEPVAVQAAAGLAREIVAVARAVGRAPRALPAR